MERPRSDPEESPDLPAGPGCYLFRDADGEIIYVGKARSIKKRVGSYFTRRDLDKKTRAMVARVASVDYIVTTNEVEALILENSLIKTNQPRYNIDLKDAKQYAYIELSGDEFPCLRIARRRSDGGTTFGPFVSAAERDYVFTALKKTFRLRTCRTLPKRGCLRRHLGSCSAPCRGEISAEEYREDVRKASFVLRGKAGELLSRLRGEMQGAAGREEFEQARLLRDQIAAIEGLREHQHIDRPKDSDEDVINWVSSGGRVFLMVFLVHSGTLVNKREFVFDDREGVISEFLTRYYDEYEPPATLILPEVVDEALPGYLSIRKGRPVELEVPARGPKKRLIELVRMNIETRFFGDAIKVSSLGESLDLGKDPAVIECFDISHLSGTATVGSMVRFSNGKADKKSYRRFRIRNAGSIDDTAAIGEVVGRRYARLLAEGAALPDLVVVDGGRGQLHAASAAIRNAGCRIPVIALAKRNEEVYREGDTGPLPLGRKDRASLYLQEIRDEAHRFAVSYNRILRRKKVVP
jgi:excinuclease ABC subunit C